MNTIEESVEIDVPVRTAYNQWTQFEEFPSFMEGVESVRQIDDTHLHWVAEIGGVKREWDAVVTEQHPDEQSDDRNVVQHAPVVAHAVGDPAQAEDQQGIEHAGAVAANLWRAQRRAARPRPSDDEARGAGRDVSGSVGHHGATPTRGAPSGGAGRACGCRRAFAALWQASPGPTSGTSRQPEDLINILITHPPSECNGMIAAPFE